MAQPGKGFDPRNEENYWKPEVIGDEGKGNDKPSGNLKSVDLNSAEDSATSKTKQNQVSSTEKQDLPETTSSVKNSKTTTKGLRGKWRMASKWKKRGSIAAIIAGLGGALMLGFFALIPLKLQFIITNIQNKVADVPQYAIERRLEYLTTDYLLRRVGARTAVDSANNLYLGNSFTDTLYTNWKAAQYEKGIFNDLGIEIEKVGQVGRYGEPASWRVTSSDFGSLSHDGKSDLFNSKEMRKLIKDFSINDTKSHEVLKRHHMRRIMRKKYGIRQWRFFEGPRETLSKTTLQIKKRIYIKLVENTIGQVSAKTGTYLTCILEGKDACSFRNSGTDATAADTNNNSNTDAQADAEADARNSASSGGSVDESLEEIAGEAIEEVDVNAPNSRGKASKTVQKFALKKVLGYFVSGIGFLATISAVDEAIDSGAVSAVIADRNMLSYVGYSTTFLTINDQMTSGQEVSSREVDALFEILENFEESPVYQAEFGGLNSSGVVSAAAGIARDCDGDGVNDTTLDPGELVCDNKKVIVDVEGGMIKHPAYQAFHSVVEVYNDTLGVAVTGLLNIIANITDAIVGDLLANITSALGLDELFAGFFEFMMNWVFGVTITGLETGGDAYDAIRAGVEISSYELMEDRQYGAGGMYLTETQVADITDFTESERQTELQARPLFARLFSTSEDSLLLRTAMSLPSSLDKMLASLAKLPANILSTSQELVTFIVAPKFATAQSSGFTSNPFNVVQTGYPLDTDPEYTETGAIDLTNPPTTFDFDTPPGVLWEKYGCQVYVDGTPEEIEEHQRNFYGKVDGVPYEVPTAMNPCMLEKAVSEAAGAIYGGNLSDGVGGYVPNSTSTVPIPLTPPVSTAPECPPNYIPKPGDPPCVL